MMTFRIGGALPVGLLSRPRPGARPIERFGREATSDLWPALWKEGATEISETGLDDIQRNMKEWGRDILPLEEGKEQIGVGTTEVEKEDSQGHLTEFVRRSREFATRTAQELGRAVILFAISPKIDEAFKRVTVGIPTDWKYLKTWHMEVPGSQIVFPDGQRYIINERSGPEIIYRHEVPQYPV